MVKLPKTNKDKFIHFDEPAHVYTNGYGEKLISVSTLIHLYSPPFDPTGKILIRCAAKQDKTPEVLQKEWDYERDSACDRGNSFHKQAEYWVLNNKIKEDGDYVDVIKQLAALPFKGKLEPERIVFNNKLGIAGTIDLTENFNNGHKKLLDYKTNKKIKFKGFWDRDLRRPQMMEYPVNHLEDCNWNHYCLQICGYQVIEEENRAIIDSRELIYVNPKSRKLELYEIPDLRKEFMDILNHYSNLVNF